jgi:hypothetical protein
LAPVAVQWVHLGAGKLLIASGRGAWIQPLKLAGLALSAPMPPSLPGTPETTRHLLDGAIAAAEQAAPLPSAPRITARRWAWELVNQWYVATKSIALLEEAHERYATLGRRELAEFTHHRLEEERGHDQFPLEDLSALGYEAEKVVRTLPPAAAASALIDYAGESLCGREPIEFLGYIHAMERHVLRLSPDWFAALEKVLPPGVDAASGLRAHVTDLDIEHVDEAVSFFATLAADDRARLAVGCYQTTLIRNAPTGVPDPSEGDLETWFAPLQTQAAGKINQST